MAPQKPASRPIQKFAATGRPVPKPSAPPSRGGTPTSEQAIRIAKNPPGINPRQQHN